MTIGERLRHIRKQQKLTLTQLSKLCGVSASTLSRMENTDLSVNLEKLQRIAVTLGIDQSKLLASANLKSDKKANSPEKILARRSIERKGQAKVLNEGDMKTRYLFSDLRKKRMDVMHIELHPTPIEETEFIKHPGEKLMYVLDGTIEIHSEYYTTTRFESGDAMYIDSNMWHCAIAIGAKPAKILVVFSPDPNRHQPVIQARTFSSDELANCPNN